MLCSINVETNCELVGDFVAENELPLPAAPVSLAKTELTEYVGTFVDDWPGDLKTVQFRVLLRDNRVVTVRGHALQYLPNPSNPADQGSYGILGRNGPEEVLVALFRVSEVTGIFSGGLEPAKVSA